MLRYDTYFRKISCSCYSGFVRVGGKAEPDIVENAEEILSEYLLDAGKMMDLPKIQAISPRVNNTSPKSTFVVSGRHLILFFSFLYYILNDQQRHQEDRLG